MPIKRSYYIDAPVETAFDFAKTMKWADLAAPMEVSDVKVTEEGTGSSYAWAFKAAGLRFTGFDVITDIVPDRSMTLRSAGAFPGTTVNMFEPEGTGTRWTMEYRPGSFWRVPPLDKLVQLGFRRRGETFARRVKESVEALSKGGAQPEAAAAGEVRTVKRSVHIEAPVETVYDTVYGSFTDPEKMRELMEHDVQVDDMKVTRAGGGTFFSWHGRIAGIPMRGFDVLTDVVPGRHITEKSSNAIVGTWDYDFEPEGSGTRLTLEHRSRSIWNVPPMRNATDVATGKVTDSLMARLKETIEASAR